MDIIRKYRLGLMAAAIAGLALNACSGYGSSSSYSSTYFAVTNLVSNGGTAATYTDANLVNPWGLAMSPTGPIWSANNGTQTATLYDGNGIADASIVAMPDGTNGAAAVTGIVYNSGSDFVISNGGSSGAASFILDGEGGTILGWSQAVDPSNAVIAYDDGAGGAIYKGLAIARNGGTDFLYATDFHNNKIDVFDNNFAKIDSSGQFTDPDIPDNYAPFGIQAINGQLYVTYAEQAAPDNEDEVDGAGLGYVDVYATDGTLVSHLIATGHLNAPWGLALAPAGFGSFGNDLLVGNFGDGLINAYDPITGAFKGTLANAVGNPIAIPGLWGMTFGNGTSTQPASTLFFAAGINDEADGLFGRIIATTSTMCSGYGC